MNTGKRLQLAPRPGMVRTFIHAAPLLWVCAAGLAYAQDPAAVELLNFKEINRMEAAAEAAGDNFWRGRYSEAEAVFKQLTATKHASMCLYLCELGFCLAAQGDYANARQNLLEAVQWMEQFARPDLKKKERSKLERQGEKLYRGDPYEHVCANLILALLYLDAGDYDNAITACRSAQLADSDWTEDRYGSDFALLFLLEAKCHLLRGKPEEAQTAFGKARQSYRLIYPQVRYTACQRQYWLQMLQLSKSDRKRQGVRDEDTALQSRVAALEEKLAAENMPVEAELGALITGDYNVLLVLPQGKSPRKTRIGWGGNAVVFDVSPGRYPPTDVVLDGRPQVLDYLKNVADVSFQALTRKGREIDQIIQGNPTFKPPSMSMGRGFTNTFYRVSLGGAVTSETDTRCWRTLPHEFNVVPLTLPPGEHSVRFRQRIYFQNVATASRQFTVRAGNDLKILLAPPSMVGKFSASAQVDRSRARKRAEAAGGAATDRILLLPPVLGLLQIEKFPSEDQASRPRAFAPDADEAVRRIRQAVAKPGWILKTVDHFEALQPQPETVRGATAALQCELFGLDHKINRKSETFGADYEFTLVDVESGEPLRSKKVGVVCERSGQIQCAEVFYALTERAASDLASDPEFLKPVSAVLSTQTK